jgi:hypothetical protein
MATVLEQALFAEEFIQVKSMPEADRWTIEQDKDVPLGIFLTLHPVNHPKELFRARIRWSNYFEAPSLKFVNLGNGSIADPQAWPLCFGFRPGSMDACLPWTAEGQALHPEWRNSSNQSFPTVEAPMQYALLRVQSALDISYQKRGP